MPTPPAPAAEFATLPSPAGYLRSRLRALSFERKPRLHADNPRPRPRRTFSFGRWAVKAAWPEAQATASSPATAVAEVSNPPGWAAAEIQLFNSGKPVAALAALGLSQPVQRWAAATFLHRTAGLDMQVLGELLGSVEQRPLMEAYIRKIDFSGLSLERSLRVLLSGFRLPGEAQKIDRLMETFAAHWHATSGMATLDQPRINPAHPSPPTLTADTAYLLSFALIMLNTDMHSPAIKKKRKMSPAQWRANLRGTGPGGADLPPQYLQQLYDGISRAEIRLSLPSGQTGGGGRSAAIVPLLAAPAIDRVRGRVQRASAAVRFLVRVQRRVVGAPLWLPYADERRLPPFPPLAPGGSSAELRPELQSPSPELPSPSARAATPSAEPRFATAADKLPPFPRSYHSSSHSSSDDDEPRGDARARVRTASTGGEAVPVAASFDRPDRPFTEAPEDEPPIEKVLLSRSQAEAAAAAAAAAAASTAAGGDRSRSLSPQPSASQPISPHPRRSALSWLLRQRMSSLRSSDSTASLDSREHGELTLTLAARPASNDPTATRLAVPARRIHVKRLGSPRPSPRVPQQCSSATGGAAGARRPITPSRLHAAPASHEAEGVDRSSRGGLLLRRLASWTSRQTSSPRLQAR